MSSGENSATVRVMVRCRPFVEREVLLSTKAKEPLRPVVRMRGNTCAVVEYKTDRVGATIEREREAFEFDECFWSIPPSGDSLSRAPSSPTATQRYVFDRCGRLASQHALQGYNVCIFAYGQTGSGKTYTMMGTEQEEGISPLLVCDIFASIENLQQQSAAMTITVECTFFEIYNERVRDLLNKKQGEYELCRVRQHPVRGVYVEKLQRIEATQTSVAIGILRAGSEGRAVAETKMNLASSRSHAIFQLSIVQKDPTRGTQRTSIVNLVDLAGSEKLKQSESTGMTATEAKNVNLSLTTLRRVIDVLIENSQNKKQLIPPFRESLLTYLLCDSLGGNSKTQMVAAISPHESNLEDTLSTLRYAFRAKAIVCKARINEEDTAEMVSALRSELTRLRKMLSEEGSVKSSSPRPQMEDIRNEIAEREAEIAKMEEEQKKMAETVKVMEAKIEVIDAARVELKKEVGEQRQERFAAAFRNVIALHREKSSMQKRRAEINELQRLATSYHRQLKECDSQLLSLRHDNNELHQLKEIDREFNAEQVINLKNKVDALERELLKFRRDNAALSSNQNDLRYSLTSSSETIQVLEQELNSKSMELERQRRSADEMRSRWAEEKAAHLEQLRTYQEHVEDLENRMKGEQVTVSTLKGQVDSAITNRSYMLETIRSLQSALKESQSLYSTALQQLDESRATISTYQSLSEDRLSIVQTLEAALRQYQRDAHHRGTAASLERSAMEKHLQTRPMFLHGRASSAEQASIQSHRNGARRVSSMTQRRHFIV